MAINSWGSEGGVFSRGEYFISTSQAVHVSQRRGSYRFPAVEQPCRNRQEFLPVS